MQLLPYNELYIRTRLLHSDLVKKLQLITDSSTHLIKPYFNKKKYYGQVTTDGFKIHRWISRHGSRSYGQGYSVHYSIFPPVITGEFLDAKNGEIIIRMRFLLQWSALISFIFWVMLYGLIVSVLFIIPLTYIIEKSHLYVSNNLILGFILILTLLPLILTYTSMLSLFKQNTKYEKEYFLKLTEAYEVIDEA